jgi:hypothetical protein
MRAAAITVLFAAVSAAGCSHNATRIEVTQTSMENLPPETRVGVVRVQVDYDRFSNADPFNTFGVEAREKQWIYLVRKGFSRKVIKSGFNGPADGSLRVVIRLVDIDVQAQDPRRCPIRPARPIGTTPAVVRAKVSVGPHGEFMVAGLCWIKKDGSGFEEFAEDLGEEIAGEIDRLRHES